MVQLAALMIELRAVIGACGPWDEIACRRLALRATRFVRDHAEAERLADRLFHELDFVSLQIELNGVAAVDRQDAMDVLAEIERASISSA